VLGLDEHHEKALKELGVSVADYEEKRRKEDMGNIL